MTHVQLLKGSPRSSWTLRTPSRSCDHIPSILKAFPSRRLQLSESFSTLETPTLRVLHLSEAPPSEPETSSCRSMWISPSHRDGYTAQFFFTFKMCNTPIPMWTVIHSSWYSCMAMPPIKRGNRSRYEESSTCWSCNYQSKIFTSTLAFLSDTKVPSSPRRRGSLLEPLGHHTHLLYPPAISLCRLHSIPFPFNQTTNSHTRGSLGLYHTGAPNMKGVFSTVLWQVPSWRVRSLMAGRFHYRPDFYPLHDVSWFKQYFCFWLINLSDQKQHFTTICTILSSD